MKVVIKVITAVLIVTLVGGMSYLLFFAPKSPTIEMEDPELQIGEIGKAPVLKAEEGLIDRGSLFKALYEQAIAPGATDEQKIEAVYAMYRVGCLQRYTSNFVSTAFGATGGVSAAGGYGYLRFFNTSYNVRIPGATLDRADKSKYNYYGTKYDFCISPDSDDGGNTLLGIVFDLLIANLTFARSNAILTDGEFNATTSARLDNLTVTSNSIAPPAAGFKNYSYTTQEQKDKNREKEWKDGKIEKAQVYDENWYDEYGLDAPDYNSDLVNRNTILADSISFESKTDGYGKEFYVVKYSLKLDDSALKYTAYGMVSAAPDAVGATLTYSQLDTTLEIWPTGHFRSVKQDQKWTLATTKILVIAAESVPITTEYFGYNKNQCIEGIKSQYPTAAQMGKNVTWKPFVLTNKGQTFTVDVQQ